MADHITSGLGPASNNRGGVGRGTEADGSNVAGAGSHRLFHLRARNVMEKQQWLHTLSPLRFPEIPEAVPKEGKQPSCIIGVYNDA